MSVRDTTTYEELTALIKAAPRMVHWRLEGNLYVKGQKVLYSNIVNQTILCDFDARYYGDNFLTLKVDPVAYRHILKYKNDLQFELTKAQQSASGVVETEIYRFSQLYDAYLLEPDDPAVTARLNNEERKDGTIMQISNLMDVTFQLVEPVVSDFRLEEVGGTFRNVTVEEVLRTLLGYGLGPSENPDMLKDSNYLGIRGVDIRPVDNTRRYDHIVIPNGTRLYELPKRLQEDYGVYSSGIGWHINRGWCFVYPLLNYTLFTQRKKTLTILNVPSSEIPTMERTFLNRSDQIYVFATGDSRFMDISESVQLNRGTGIRFSPASDLLDNLTLNTQNKAIFNQAKNVKAFEVQRRPNEKANVRHTQEHFTDNPFKHASRLSESLGTPVEVEWDRSAPELLYPGMQVKFLYKDGERLNSLVGTLMGTRIETATNSGALLDAHFITRTTLTLYLKRQDME